MEEIEMPIMQQKKRRFAYRIVENMPKTIRIIYYILLIITLVYVVYRLLRYFLIGLQKAGYFCFNPQHYWIFMSCVAITLIISLILAQFVWNQDPIGKTGQFISDGINNFRRALGNWIGGE